MRYAILVILAFFTSSYVHAVSLYDDKSDVNAGNKIYSNISIDASFFVKPNTPDKLRPTDIHDFPGKANFSKKAKCGISPSSIKTFILGNYSEAMLSTVWLNSEQGHMTGAVTITLEDISEPLRLIFLNEEIPHIFLFNGDNSKIDELIILSDNTSDINIGIVGLPADKIKFIRADAFEWCVNEIFYDRYNYANSHGMIYGRYKDMLVGNKIYNIWDLKYYDSINIFVSTIFPEGFPGPASNDISIPNVDNAIYDKFKEQFPNGIKYVDPASVVSVEPVGTYHLLPKEAGLLEGIASGVFKIDKDDPNVIHVVRDTYLPPYLCAIENIKTIIEPGVHILGGTPCN